MRWGCVALFVLVARVASADPLADAKTQVAASDYLKARVSLDEAFASGTNGPEQLAEIWRLRGIVAGALDETKVATDAFQRCLALSPKADLPPGTSPKITRPFTAAQDFFKKNEPLGIKQEAKQDPPSIAVLVTSDPLSMIARLQVSVKVDGATEKVLDNKFAGQEQIDFALPAGARLDLRVAALDEKGNRLAELGSADVPIVIVGKPVDKTPVLVVGQKPPTRSTKPPAPVRERAFVWKWWLWGGGAVLFAGAATYFGVDGLRAKSDLEDLNADSPNHSFDEAKDLESRAKRDFLFANIGYGVAGALAITATILFLTEPDQPSSESRVTAVPVEGGAALVFGGQF
jgi:hypothetical protein